MSVRNGEDGISRSRATCCWRTAGVSRLVRPAPAGVSLLLANGEPRKMGRERHTGGLSMATDLTALLRTALIEELEELK
ncbi:MAG TPA: hypothetical protein VEL76_02850, partial [Gemmataceae bacterium]|nr:hypothetical protein [Gemmataceae bacterium]